MKNSIIYTFLDENREYCVAIWSNAYMKQAMKTATQLIEAVGIIQTQEERTNMKCMNQDKLVNALLWFIKKNELYVERPN